MTAMRPRPLVEIAEAAIAAFDEPSTRQNDILVRIRRHAERLAADRFQLAVLGQFKRGKSTLLNALVGHRLLATGILPLTAIPTFLFEGEQPAIALTYLDGRVEREEASDWRELARKIAEATTEEKNPGNVRHLQRVDVTLPAGTLLDSMVLIDTPGVGSTYTHNTEAAEDVLPECDAALFVVSADPPITEVELKYLGQICRSVPHVVVVLNKVDLFGNDDREKALSFLKTVLSGADLPQVDPNIFSVSAKAALDARLAGKKAGLIQSGLIGLESYIHQSLMRKKADLLEASALRNIRVGITELRNEVGLSRHALALPLEKLDENIAIFEKAVERLRTEQQSLDDLLNGEWRRSLALLDEIALDGERRTIAALDEKLTPYLVSEASEETIRSTLDRIMPELFDKELSAVIDRIGYHIGDAVAQHERRYLGLVRKVHETAAAALNADIPPPLAQEGFTPLKQPYWTTRGLTENLGSVTRDWLALLLPRRIRQRRQREVLRRSAVAAVGKNVSNLHWAMRQNIDDNFRRLLSSCHQSVEDSIVRTRDILASVRDRRGSEDTSVRNDLDRLERIARRLEELERDLASHGTTAT